MSVRHVAPTLEAARAVIAGDVGLIVVEGEHQPGCTSTVPFPIASCCQYAAPPAEFVRAVESGERIEIAARTECPHVDCRGVGDYCCWGCRGSGHGLVVVGSVQATAVLEVWHFERQGSHRGVAHLCVVDAIGDAGPWVLEYDTEGQQIDDHAAALSVYGPPASLIGRYAVSLTDPRRTE